MKRYRWPSANLIALCSLLWLGVVASGCIYPDDEVCPIDTVRDPSGQCVLGCNTNDDCSGDRICQQVVCVKAPCYGICGNPECKSHDQCGKDAYCDADTNTCKKLGYCDVAKDCYGQPLVTILCIGEFSCNNHSCDFHCGTSTCAPIKDGDFGDCDMVMGYGWNGTSCATISGCGCNDSDPACSRIYPTLEECQKATSICVPQKKLKWYTTCGYPVCGPDATSLDRGRSLTPPSWRAANAARLPSALTATS